jgi:hypothetical protein
MNDREQFNEWLKNKGEGVPSGFNQVERMFEAFQAGKSASDDKTGPVAYAILAANGKVRIWWNKKESALDRCFGKDGQYDNLADGEQFVELYAKPFTKAMSEKG